MTDFAEIKLADDTTVRLELAPVGGASLPGDDATDQDLPGGIGGSTPVGRGGAGASRLAVGTLRTALRPLGPLLQEVHDSMTAAADPPQEISVQFGVQIGQDLKLGVVGANGQASLTVSATWRPGSPAGTG